MQLKIHVAQLTALRAGRALPPTVTVEVTDDMLAQLTKEERDKLAASIADGAVRPAMYQSATGDWEGLISEIRSDLAKAARAAAETAAARAARVQARRTAYAERGVDALLYGDCVSSEVWQLSADLADLLPEAKAEAAAKAAATQARCAIADAAYAASAAIEVTRIKAYRDRLLAWAAEHDPRVQAGLDSGHDMMSAAYDYAASDVAEALVAIGTVATHRAGGVWCQSTTLTERTSPSAQALDLYGRAKEVLDHEIARGRWPVTVELDRIQRVEWEGDVERVKTTIVVWVRGAIGETRRAVTISAE